MSENTEEKNNNIANDQSKPNNMENESDSSRLSEKETYFNALRFWHRNYVQHEMATNSFPYYLIANYPQLFQANGSLSARNTNNTGQNLFPQVNGQRQNQRPGRLFNYFDSTRQARQDEIIALNGGYEYNKP